MKIGPTGGHPGLGLGAATANVQNEMTSRYVYRPAARELLR